MTRKSKNSKRKCKARKYTIKNRRGKGGIFSCANKSDYYKSKSDPAPAPASASAPGPGAKWTGRKSGQGPKSEVTSESKSELKSLFRENSQDSINYGDEYGNFLLIDTKENPPQTKVTESYTGNRRSKIHKKIHKKNKTS